MSKNAALSSRQAVQENQAQIKKQDSNKSHTPKKSISEPSYKAFNDLQAENSKLKAENHRLRAQMEKMRKDFLELSE